VIEGQFEYPIGAKALGFSHGDFSLVVQALYDPTGNQLLSPEVVKNSLPMLAKRAGDLLHGLDAGTHGLAAALVQKSAGPAGELYSQSCREEAR
jgi:hypothetical protein